MIKDIFHENSFFFGNLLNQNILANLSIVMSKIITFADLVVECVRASTHVKL